MHRGGAKDAREVRIVSDVGFRWVSQTRTNNVDPIAVNPSQTGVYHASKWLMDKTAQASVVDQGDVSTEWRKIWIKGS